MRISLFQITRKPKGKHRLPTVIRLATLGNFNIVNIHLYPPCRIALDADAPILEFEEL